MPEPNKKRTKEEYEKILVAFRRLVHVYENSAGRWEAFEDIVTLRASFLIDRAITGLRIDFDRALILLKGHNDFVTERDRLERDLLIAAIDNLIDFAAAQQMQMLEELPDEPDSDDTDSYEPICEKYNLRYAAGENQDVSYAASVAGWWIGLPDETLVTFMTQGDERVRAWHLSHEGVSYPKNDFPAELIPPIEFGCRCFLVTNGFDSVYGSAKKSEYTERINPVFRESLAKGGKIFSPAHPYFKKQFSKEVQDIAFKIKSKFNIV